MVPSGGYLLHILRGIVIAALFALLSNGVACAGEEKIAELIVKGNRRIESVVILNAVKLKAGEPLAIEQVDSDIRAIYKLGYFQDVKAETEKSDKGVVLIYTVVEKPIVREVRIDGNKEISADKIREAFALKPGAVFSAKELTSGVKKVKKLYSDDGYYLAEVDAATEKRSETELRVLLKISEGEKVLIKRIRFEGNRAFSDRKLKKEMETGEKWFLSWLTGGGTYKEEVLKNDVALVADLYYNNGYVNVKVGEPKVELLEDKSGLLVTIGITEGDQFRTGSLDFKGDLLVDREELAKKVKLKTGEVFSRGVLRGDIFTLTDLYGDMGYAFANVSPLSQADPEKKTINITFDFEKGEKVHIDRINISGNTKTRDKVVRREMRLDEGGLYGTTPLKKSKQNLMNLGFFEEANISTAKGSAANKLNVNVEVKEKPTGTFSIGAGYSSLDGLIGQGSVQQANFLGLGLKANAAASLGGKTQTYNVGLTDNYFMDTRWTLGADIYRTERDYTDYSKRVTGGDIKAGYPLSETLSTLWVYRYEDKKIFDISDALQQSIALGLETQPEETSTTSSISASLSRNTTDYRLDPTKGMVNGLSVEFAGLGGTNRFLRFIGNTRAYFPVIWGTVFSLHGELGYVDGLGKEVPIDERFYLGGINTLRGYRSREVGPNVSSPAPVSTLLGVTSASVNRAFTGGDTEAYFNAEFTFPLLKEVGLKGVAFFDIGNAYDGFDRIFSTSMQASYGAGIRWFSPIGPLRLEYGIPLNPRSGIDSASGKLEFSIGSFF
ncbi:MAG: outer membrane protein assembly factor BamA [Geobacteraceae bacterium]|nr:outer membrane protein assembly factor BamA [Geobacteraceae bacterium]